MLSILLLSLIPAFGAGVFARWYWHRVDRILLGIVALCGTLATIFCLALLGIEFPAATGLSLLSATGGFYVPELLCGSAPRIERGFRSLSRGRNGLWALGILAVGYILLTQDTRIIGGAVILAVLMLAKKVNPPKGGKKK